MNAVTHLEKVIVGEVSAVTHLEKVIAGETSAVTYTEKVITGEAPAVTHLQKVIAGEASPVTHLEYIWAGGSPQPTEHEYTGAVPYTFTANGSPLISWRISGNTVQFGTPTPDSPVMPEGCGDLETSGEKAGQYKISISSANTTTPVYLGEVQTTRKVKKLVLSSSQNWKLQSTNSHGIANFYITITNDFLNISLAISNYFTRQITAIADTTTEGMLIALSINTATVYIRVKSQTASTAQEFKDWLDGLSEEAAIWYVLATPETAVVNEPLMKIGDYADEVSNVATIPTNNGSTTIDVETTVKPSEVYIKYKGV